VALDEPPFAVLAAQHAGQPAGDLLTVRGYEGRAVGKPAGIAGLPDPRVAGPDGQIPGLELLAQGRLDLRPAFPPLVGIGADRHRARVVGAHALDRLDVARRERLVKAADHLAEFAWPGHAPRRVASAGLCLAPGPARNTCKPAQPAAAVKRSPTGPSAASREAVRLTDAGWRSYSPAHQRAPR
jgi:hypothetical protein